VDEARERVRAQHAVDDDLHWQGHEQGNGGREQAQEKHSGKVRPVRPCLAPQPPVEGEIGTGHQTLSMSDCPRVRTIAAVLAAHSCAARSAGSRAAMPRMTLTGQDGSIAAAVERAANTTVSVTPMGEHLGQVRSRTSRVPWPGAATGTSDRGARNSPPLL